MRYTRVKLYRFYAVDFDLTQLDEYKWCVETFKLPSDLREWYVNATWNKIEFSFRDPAHALMFSLRWAE